ncbi:response regulator [Cohnella thermotolerans]|uniref:response regulator n=1 Tax=Cohnella thermotolerans TaxID=329858 RepID=UPI00040ACADE|nr:response regulator [Cohnella thermotolerans]
MYKFIIVDDEALIRRGMLKKIRSSDIGRELEFAGEADNGEDGLALIRSANPDIVLTDMRMPEMDGRSFLQALQQDYPDKKVIVVSGYSDFEYMKEAISAKAVGYLLKPFSREEIQETLSKAVRLIEAERSAMQKMEISEHEKEEISYGADLQTMCGLILGNHRKDKAPVFRSNKMRALAGNKCCVLLTLYASDKLEAGPEFLDDGLYVPHSQNDRMGFILLTSSGKEVELEASARRTAERIVESMPLHTIVGVSRVKSSWSQLEEAFGETVAALNGRPAGEVGAPVAVYQEANIPSSDEASWDKMDELLFFLESGNARRVAEWTDKLFAYFRSVPSLSLAAVKDTCRILIHEVRNVLHRYLSINGNQTSASFETLLAASFDLESIREYLIRVLPDIADMLNERSVYSSEHVVDNIKTYVEQNPDKVLTLEKISSLFFLNPSYCSFLFKEKTGINFIDYVNQVRIGKAKLLLQTTDDKVYKIAKALGYDNTKYFFRVFKKVAGLTPEEYRQQASQKDKQA